MKAVIYARYSSDNQREESIEGQLRECQEFAKQNGFTILKNYIDRAYSAKIDNRPEFQHMMKDSAKGLFDVVIVWKLDRFARNRYDSAHNKTILRRNGVKVVSAKENISEGSEGIILEAMLEGYAEYFSAELSEKVIRGMTENTLKAKFNGGTLTFGYIIDKEKNFQIDPAAAPLIQKAFTLYSRGKGVKEIAEWLNENGILALRKNPMDMDSVSRMLGNRRYIGEYKFRDVVQPDAIPAIIEKELFERVQLQMQKNKKAPARHKAEDDYLLTTKLRCGKCSSFMVGECGTSSTGRVYHYYKCTSAKKRTGCNKKAVKKDWIENLVVDETVKLLYDDRLLEQLTDKLLDLQNRENTSIPLMRQQLAETQKGIENMLDAIQQGILTSSTKERLDKLEEIKSKLELAIAREEMEQPILTREHITFFFHKFRELDVTKQDQRQRLIDSFINAIYLYDDKIVLTFNYKEGTKTISLDEISRSDLNVSAVPAVPLLALFFCG